jgi:hypothetical protein
VEGMMGGRGRSMEGWTRRGKKESGWEGGRGEK